MQPLLPCTPTPLPACCARCARCARWLFRGWTLALEDACVLLPGGERLRVAALRLGPPEQPVGAGVRVCRPCLY